MERRQKAAWRDALARNSLQLGDWYGIREPALHEIGDERRYSTLRLFVHALSRRADEDVFVELAGSPTRAAVDMASEPLVESQA